MYDCPSTLVANVGDPQATKRAYPKWTQAEYQQKVRKGTAVERALQISGLEYSLMASTTVHVLALPY